jgi:hypothetical protein
VIGSPIQSNEASEGETQLIRLAGEVYRELNSSQPSTIKVCRRSKTVTSQHCVLNHYFILDLNCLPRFHQYTKMSTEAAAAIVFGILQVSIGLAALWQQRQAQGR